MKALLVFFLIYLYQTYADDSDKLQNIDKIPLINVNSLVTAYKNENNPFSGQGEYNFEYELSDNTKRQESGQLDEDGNLVVTGSYSYVDPDGHIRTVDYYADKTGYHPTISVGTPSFPPILTASLPSSVVATLLGR